ncbi:MAG: lysylphosphatidylglycerol synthase domain-containing protein [Acidobacteriota bacterium]|nr:lysylphosphatidylglycerol synthase domain-containing protein [Acidobacteriota bacterium]
MGQKTRKSKITKKHTAIGVVFSVLGLMLFAYFVEKAGPAEIFNSIRRLGLGFLIILALGGLRQAVHAVCWVMSCEPPHRLRFMDTFKARLMGESLNMLPLGSVLSEPSKALFIRDNIPMTTRISALAIENVFYALSVALFISAGAIALLLSFPLPASLRYASIGALVSVVIIVPIGALVIRKQLRFLSGALAYAGNRGVAQKKISDVLPRLRTIEDRIYGFYERNHARFFLILGLEMCFHIFGVIEGYITLSFISVVAPTLLTAFILESVNRLINVVFKFIPLRAGVDEGGTATLAKILGFSTTTGVTLAIVRKGRDICWAAVGFALMVHRGISLRAAARESESVVEDLSSPDEALAVSAGESV